MKYIVSSALLLLIVALHNVAMAKVTNELFKNINDEWCALDANGDGPCSRTTGFAHNVYTPSGRVNATYHLTQSYEIYEDFVRVERRTEELKKTWHYNFRNGKRNIHSVGSYYYEHFDCTVEYNLTYVNREAKHEYESDCN